jgi:hypothetical protein
MSTEGVHRNGFIVASSMSGESSVLAVNSTKICVMPHWAVRSAVASAITANLFIWIMITQRGNYGDSCARTAIGDWACFVTMRIVCALLPIT